MHEVQVQVGETQVGQTGPARLFNVLWVVFGVPQFGCDKHLVTAQSLEGEGERVYKHSLFNSGEYLIVKGSLRVHAHENVKSL